MRRKLEDEELIGVVEKLLVTKGGTQIFEGLKMNNIHTIPQCYILFMLLGINYI